MAVEIIVVFLAALAAIAVYYVLKTLKHLIVNTVLGLILLVVINTVFTMDIAYSVPVLLVCAFGGIPGAILVTLLHAMGIAFV